MQIDDLRGTPVGAHLEGIAARELEEIGDLRQDPGDLRVLHDPPPSRRGSASTAK